MFDYHMHTAVSFDGSGTAEQMVQKALAAGIKEICFTDHLDYDPLAQVQTMNFDTAEYNAAYDDLFHPDLKIRRGAEFGMLPDNREIFAKDMLRRPFDFVIGSVHFVDGLDIYYKTYWDQRTPEEAERRYFEQMLDCVQIHGDFDVLGHLTYIGKLNANPNRRPISCDDYPELTDEILRILVQRGKGIEVNTSGFDCCGAYLPGADFLRRFKELGGQIVTVGSDAHEPSRVGQYCREACQMVADIFGYVCTFENRNPIFHKL